MELEESQFEFFKLINIKLNKFSFLNKIIFKNVKKINKVCFIKKINIKSVNYYDPKFFFPNSNISKTCLLNFFFKSYFKKYVQNYKNLKIYLKIIDWTKNVVCIGHNYSYNVKCLLLCTNKSIKLK